jgi:hypothetical protein
VGGRRPSQTGTVARPLLGQYQNTKAAVQKSLICSICSGSPRYYNQLIVEPGAPHPPSEDGDPAFLLATKPRFYASGHRIAPRLSCR